MKINQTSDTLDFVNVATQESLNFSDKCIGIMESMFNDELCYFETCLDMGQIVMEAEANQSTEKTVKKQNALAALIEALKNLINRFIDKANEMSESVKKKMTYVTGKFSDESFWKKLNEVECIPYWQNSKTKIINDCENFVDILLAKFQADPSKYSNSQELQSLIRQRIGFAKYDFKNALEAYFASGKKDVELKAGKFSYTVLHKNGEEIVNSCSQYGTTSKAFSKIVSKVDNRLRTLKVVTESVIYASSFQDTLLGVLPREYSIVKEEAEDKQMQDGKINDAPKNNQSNSDQKADLNTNIKINKSEEDNTTKSTTNSNVKGLPELNACIQTIIGAAMNILQKKFLNSKAIINALTPDEVNANKQK